MFGQILNIPMFDPFWGGGVDSMCHRGVRKRGGSTGVKMSKKGVIQGPPGALTLTSENISIHTFWAKLYFSCLNLLKLIKLIVKKETTLSYVL